MKITGYYTDSLTKVLRAGMKKGRIGCQVEDGYAYVTNGMFIAKVTPAEYSALVFPAVKVDMGDWTYKNGELVVDASEKVNFKEYLDNAVSGALYHVTVSNMALSGKDGYVHCAYSTDGDFVTGYNAAYLSIFAEGYQVDEYKICTAGAEDTPMVISYLHEAYGSHETITNNVGVIFPARILSISGFASTLETVSAIALHSVKASEGSDKAGEQQKTIKDLQEDVSTEKARADTLAQACGDLREKLESEKRHAEAAEADCRNMENMIRAAREQNDTIRAERDSLREELERLRAEVDSMKQNAQHTAHEQTQAEKLAAMGLTVQVKGAQSAHPVSWIVGNTGGHEEELRDMGWTWANKRQAWYKAGCAA